MNNTPKNTRDYGGRGRLAFLNYEAFVDRVNADAPKTTDDCYTPADVFEAVVEYVASFYDLSERCSWAQGKREKSARRWKQQSVCSVCSVCSSARESGK